MTEGRDRSRSRGVRALFARVLERMSPARRRLLLRLSVAALVVAVLVVVPGYSALQPGFYKRYAGMTDEYEAWRTSNHAKVACRSCHVRPGFARVGHSARMLGEFYLSRMWPSRTPSVLTTPTSAACSDCHFDLRTVSPSGDLLIPHRAHVEILKMDCVACHNYLVHEANPEGKHTPRMVACLECHDGEAAKNACTACHTEKAAPENHQSPQWVIVHADEQAKTDCEQCHGWTEDWCADCHSRRPRSHVEKWRSKHKLQVEKRRNCEACHEAAFCVRCHGEVPALNFDPTLKLAQ